MDKKQVQSILQDALEEKVPSSEVNLWRTVKSNLVAGTNKQQGANMNTTKPRGVSRLAYATLAVVALLALAFVTPQGYAFAQQIFKFFITTNEKSFSIPTDQGSIFTVPDTPTPPPAQILPLEPVQVSLPAPSATPDLSCGTPASQVTYFCQVKAAEEQAGFDAKELLHDPKGMKFSNVTFVPETGEVTMKFVVITGGGALYLRQGVADFPVWNTPWDKVPSDAVDHVSVNGLYAEIASGTWMVGPNSSSAKWEPGGQLSLAWRDGSHWFILAKMGDPEPIEWIKKDELIKLAEGLVDARPVDAAPPLDPEYLSTVEQAEALAGFDIPAPTLLPVGYELKRVVWANNVVRLMYGPKNSSKSELYISLGLIANFQARPCTECPPGVTEAVQVGPWQGWYWRGIFYSGAGANVQPTPTHFWEGDANFWTLTWNTDKLWLGINYSPAFNSGKEMNKETLIKIAESMK
jgi:hypothetical protein